jgi:MSHA biogenesis protein MshP
MRREAGMSLVMAIFLLVVLFLLGTFIYSLGSVQQTELALDLRGSRAYHAARSGLEYAAYQATAAVPVCVGAGAQVNVALPPANFDEFSTVTLVCTSTAHTEGTGPGSVKTLYLLVANACSQPGANGFCPNNAPGPNYVERELQLSVINPP